MNPSICAGPCRRMAGPHTGRAPEIREDVPRHAVDRQKNPPMQRLSPSSKARSGVASANDTKFIVTPQHAVPRRPDDRACLDGAIKLPGHFGKCSSYSHPQVLNPRDPRHRVRAELERRTVLGWPGSAAPTTEPGSQIRSSQLNLNSAL